MNNDCVEVDELILEISDYKNDFASVAAEKLLWKCSTGWLAHQYLQVRVHEPGVPDQARQEVRRIIKRIKVQLQQSHETRLNYLVFVCRSFESANFKSSKIPD